MGGTALDPQRVTRIKERTYLHFDVPLSVAERECFTVSADAVARRPFWPLLGFDKTERRIDFDNEPHWKITNKNRPIRYASHRDSAIFSLYCGVLNAAYEEELTRRGLAGSVLAYRADLGSNINMSKGLFDEIRQRGSCHVVCVDISKFFERIDHDLLEKHLKCVLHTTQLSKDWIKILTRLTKYESVNKDHILREIGKSAVPGRVCSIYQYRTKVRKLIQRNNTPIGIPQGSPLSGTFANVYMIEFDTMMSAYVREVGGSYRRYSDDIAVVVPNESYATSLHFALGNALECVCLSLNPDKTTSTNFFISAEGLVSEGDLLQYLGFTFDGSKILLRSSSLKRFYARMKAAIRIAVRAARHQGYPEDQIHRRSLVGRFTHWGDRRNFVQYAYNASRIMESPDIRRQLRNHVKIFNEHFSKMKERYY